MSNIREYSFKSVSGLSDIFVRSWIPENPSDIKAIIQIAHGMSEYLEYYNWIAEKLTQAGYVVLQTTISVTADLLKMMICWVISVMKTVG